MSETLRTSVPMAGMIRDPNFVDVYSNQLRLSANIGDVTIVFGVSDDVGPNQIILRDKVAVRLSLSTAKVLALNLQMAISAYENAVSEIPLTPAVTEALRSASNAIEAALRQQMTRDQGG